jgi:hypothetical protein
LQASPQLPSLVYLKCQGVKPPRCTMELPPLAVCTAA